jgi:hypothetical protein
VTWPPEQHEHPPVTTWTLQIQYEPDGWWSDHTSGLAPLESAEQFKARRQADNPRRRYRLVRVTTTQVVEAPRDGGAW